MRTAPLLQIDRLSTDEQRAKYKRIVKSQGHRAANRYVDSQVYDRNTHVFVMISHDRLEYAGMDLEGWRHPFQIILHTGDHVWIGGCHAHLGHPNVKQVGDGRDKGFDIDGNCVMSVPAEWCTFYTEDEAEGIARCIDADDQLLSYAIG